MQMSMNGSMSLQLEGGSVSTNESLPTPACPAQALESTREVSRSRDVDTDRWKCTPAKADGMRQLRFLHVSPFSGRPNLQFLEIQVFEQLGVAISALAVH